MTQQLSRADLTKELRHLETWLRDATSDGELMNIADYRSLNRSFDALTQAAALLEKEDRDARRYQVIKSMYGDEPRWFRLDSNQGRIMRIRSTGMENQPENENRWHGSLDAAIDAWLERGEEFRRLAPD